MIPDPTALRRSVLAVSVLGDLDVLPGDDGVTIPGPPSVRVSWGEIADAVGPFDPESSAGHRRLDRWMRLRWIVAALGADAASALRSAARLVALPPGHVDHPGSGWVQERLLGGVLDLGVGVHGLHRLPQLSQPATLHVLGPIGTTDEVTTLPPSVSAAVGIDPGVWWPDVRRHADRMGALAAARLSRDGRATADHPRNRDLPDPTRSVLRPVGGCDVLALLASPSLRTHLAGGDAGGMRAVAVPTRRRGWFDNSSVDPAFVAAAWVATAEGQRGLSRPVLVTRHEVTSPER